MKIEASDGMSTKEVDSYINYVKNKYPGRGIEWIHIKLDGDYVDLEFQLMPVKFERIRRITGYLVGTTDRWNDAKRSEEHDRVKHTVSPYGFGEVEE